MKFNLPFTLPLGWDVKTVECLISEDVLEKPLDGNHGGIHPKSSDYVKIGVPFIMASDLSNGSVDFGTCSFISALQASQLQKGFAKTGDVLLSHKATIGRTAIVQESAFDFIVLTPQITYYRIKNGLKLNNQYLKAYFDSSFFQGILGSWAGSGSTRAYLGITAQLKLPIIVPPIERQYAIAKHVFSINKKIELNRQTNQTLEQIAQALFKSWFVDFEPTRAKIAAKEAGASPEEIERAAMCTISGKTPDQLAQLPPNTQQNLKTTAALFPDTLVDSELGEVPEGWRLKSLSSIANYLNGLALQKFRPENGEASIPVLKIAQLKKGVADGEERASANIKPEYIVENGDVVFSWSGSLEVDLWCGGRVALNQHLFKVTSETVPKWFYYFWTKQHLESFQQIAADKAVTMGHIKRSHLDEAKCLIPNFDLFDFSAIENIICKQIELRIENFSLMSVRDELLPKLLSGEIEPN